MGEDELGRIGNNYGESAMYAASEDIAMPNNHPAKMFGRIGLDLLWDCPLPVLLVNVGLYLRDVNTPFFYCGYYGPTGGEWFIKTLFQSAVSKTMKLVNSFVTLLGFNG